MNLADVMSLKPSHAEARYSNSRFALIEAYRTIFDSTKGDRSLTLNSKITLARDLAKELETDLNRILDAHILTESANVNPTATALPS